MTKSCLSLSRKYDIIYENTSDTPILTIDDAPYSEASFKEILAVLHEHNCTATFFVNSYLITSTNLEQLLVKAVKQGNHLGNHGEMHRLHIALSDTSLFDEIQNCQVAINRIYQLANVERPAVKYYRPTVGLVNGTVDSFAKKFEYRIVLGTNFPGDPRIKIPALNDFYIRRHYAANDIIILHDRPWTPALLRRLLRTIKTGSLLDYRPRAEDALFQPAPNNTPFQGFKSR